MVEMTEAANPEHRDRPEPRADGRDRARHQHLRRPLARVGLRAPHREVSCARSRCSRRTTSSSTSSPEEIPACANVHLDATEHGDGIVFLHAVKPGPASRATGCRSRRRRAFRAKSSRAPGLIWRRSSANTGAKRRGIQGNRHEDRQGRQSARKLAKAYRVKDGERIPAQGLRSWRYRSFDKDDKTAPGRRCRQASRRSPSCRRSSTRRIAGRCCSSSRPWMPPARTAPSSTSCRGVNPQGCQVTRSRRPRAEELDHDFLWRDEALPERGRIGIFNRSYYEEVLVVRVHPEILEQPEAAAGARRRRTSGRSATRTSAPSSATCTRTAYVIRKFFLHVSKEEQKRRFLERLDEPEKNWKFAAADVARARHWDDYMKAYEDMIRHTATRMRPGTSCRPTTSGSRDHLAAAIVDRSPRSA